MRKLTVTLQIDNGRVIPIRFWGSSRFSLLTVAFAVLAKLRFAARAARWTVRETENV